VSEGVIRRKAGMSVRDPHWYDLATEVDLGAVARQYLEGSTW
jgi:hypothetical protein